MRWFRPVVRRLPSCGLPLVLAPIVPKGPATEHIHLTLYVDLGDQLREITLEEWLEIKRELGAELHWWLPVSILGPEKS